MDFRIVYTRPDGGISVVAPARPGAGQTEADMVQMAAHKAVPADATNVHYMFAQDLVAAVGGDRLLRAAWRSDGKKVHVPLDEAKEALRNRIRDGRALKMHGLDMLQVQAIGRKDQKMLDEVEARKQALRDAPADPRIDAATSLDELKAIWHPELPSKKEMGI